MITHQSFTPTAARRAPWIADREASVRQPSSVPANARARCFAEAMALLEDGRWQHAFMRFAALGDAGHPPAARIALLMVRRGTRLFGGTYRASVQRLEAWQRAVE